MLTKLTPSLNKGWIAWRNGWRDRSASHQLVTSDISLLPWTLAALYTLPSVVMAMELLKPAYSVPLVALIAAWLFALAPGFRRGGDTGDAASSAALARRDLRSGVMLRVALLCCLAWVYFSGIGSFAVCRWDYVKHNFIFSQLLEHELPIVIGEKGFVLHYPFAYYILPVRLTQILQTLHLPVDLNWLLLFFYSGIMLAAVRLIARRWSVPVLTLLVLLVFSGGADLLGMLVLGAKVQTVPMGGIPVPWNLEWWGLPYAPQSLTANLYWAPQHFFGALAGTAVILHFLRLRRPAAAVLADMAILVSAAALWSPYVAVGLAALAAVQIVFVDKGTLLRRAIQEGRAVLLRPRFLFTAAFAAAMMAFTTMFFLAAKPLTMPIFLLSGRPFWIWLVTLLANYAPFLLALAILLGLVLLASQRGDREDLSSRWRLVRSFVGFLAASALLLTVAHGAYNDWGMRSTLPLWLALAASAARLLSMPIGFPLRAALIGVLVVASADSLAELGTAFLGTPNCGSYGGVSLDALGELAVQYEGRPDSFLYRHLARNH